MVLHVNNLCIFINLMYVLKKADIGVLTKLFMLSHQVFPAVFVMYLILFVLNDLWSLVWSNKVNASCSID